MAKRLPPRGPGGRFRKRKSASSSRRKARSNAWPQAGVVVRPNPRRKKRKATRTYAVAHRRRRASRNPRVLGVEFPAVNQIIFSGVGFLAPPMVEGFINRTLPIDTGNIVIRYVVRIGSVLLLGWGTRQFIGSSEARAVMIGGSLYVGTTLLADFAPGLLTTMTGTPSGVGSYVIPRGSLPAPRRPVRSLAAYQPMGAGRGYNAGTAVNGGGASRFNRF